MGSSLFGHSSTVQLLLSDKRLDPNPTDMHGNSATVLAAREGHAEVLKHLLADKRTNPNVPNVRPRRSFPSTLDIHRHQSLSTTCSHDARFSLLASLARSLKLAQTGSWSNAPRPRRRVVPPQHSGAIARRPPHRPQPPRRRSRSSSRKRKRKRKRKRRRRSGRLRRRPARRQEAAQRSLPGIGAGRRLLRRMRFRTAQAVYAPAWRGVRGGRGELPGGCGAVMSPQ